MGKERLNLIKKTHQQIFISASLKMVELFEKCGYSKCFIQLALLIPNCNHINTLLLHCIKHNLSGQANCPSTSQ
jgi:hypothetical protein